jgi:hypothetical protein
VSLSSLFHRYNKAKGYFWERKEGSFFYWMLAYGSVPENIAVLSESLNIFIHMCACRPSPERYVC